MARPAAQPNTGASTSDLGDAALRVFFNLANSWKLSEDEQMKLLGLTSRPTLHSWKSGHATEINRDTLERISYLLGIFKGINTLLPDPDRADAWMRAPNTAPLFGGRSALDRMMSGNVADLYVVRQYLDAQRA